MSEKISIGGYFIGQHVVCVDASKGISDGAQTLVGGKTYRVLGLKHYRGVLYLFVDDGTDGSWMATRFEPANKRSALSDRKPLFERFDFDTANGCVDQSPDGSWIRYEDLQAKIQSGELMVVKTATREWVNAAGASRQIPTCSVCKEILRAMPGEFCTCGAKIIV